MIELKLRNSIAAAENFFLKGGSHEHQDQRFINPFYIYFFQPVHMLELCSKIQPGKQ